MKSCLTLIMGCVLGIFGYAQEVDTVLIEDFAPPVFETPPSSYGRNWSAEDLEYWYQMKDQGWSFKRIDFIYPDVYEGDYGLDPIKIGWRLFWGLCLYWKERGFRCGAESKYLVVLSGIPAEFGVFFKGEQLIGGPPEIWKGAYRGPQREK